MAKLLSSSYDSMTVHAMTHGVMSDTTLRGLADRARDGLGRASERSKAYIQRAYEELTSIDLGLIRDRITSVTRRKNDRSSEDRVTRLISPIDYQQAKPANRRNLMISPIARQYYYDGLIAGYHGQFEDNEKGRVGRDHTQYRELMNGSYSYSEEDGEGGFTTYLDDDLIVNPHDALSQNERTDTRDNIHQLEIYLKEGLVDPTNQLGGTI